MSEHPATNRQRRYSDGIRVALVIFSLVLLCMTWRLGQAPLAGTEGHRAVTAHQMAAGGQWLTPTLYGEPYLTKPPLHYWLLAATSRITGSSAEWVWRLPAALAAALLAAAMTIFAARWFGPVAGLVCGLSFLALIPLWSQSRSADIDSVNTLFTVLTALGLIDMTMSTRRGWRLAIPTGAAIAAMLLAKGPAGLPVAAAAMIGPAIAMRSWRPLRSGSAWSAWLAAGRHVGNCHLGEAWRRRRTRPQRPR
jgi:4-amino-4-deoxy-L-arabinose transferase-like glycosyltransferase